MSQESPVLIIVMGASGCGKSSIGLAVAQALHSPFIDADDLHPASNVAKMASGQPLNDQDRLPWLRKIRHTALILTSEKGVKRLNSDINSLNLHPASTTRNGIDLSIREEELNYVIEKIHPASLHPPNSTQSNSSSLSSKSEACIRKRHVVVLACSALKLSYRNLLRGLNGREGEGLLDTYFIYLHGTRSLLLNRMNNRPGHFMKSEMLDSQLATLEIPVPSSEPGVGRVQLGKGENESEEKGMELVVTDSVEFANNCLSVKVDE